MSPWGSGINAVPEGSVVPLESADIPRGATRGSVVPSGAPSHLLVGSRNTSTPEIHHPEGSVVPRGSSSATLARPGGSVVPRRDASGIPVVANKFPFVNVGMLNPLLKDYNPDKAKFLIDGFKEGFSLGCVDPPAGACDKNLSSCDLAPAVIDEYISTERAMGRIIGPFDESPFADYKISPIGLIPKATPGDFRVIHHLSYPRGASINDSIPAECTAVSYGSVDDAVEEIMHHAMPVFMAKTDIKCAYRIVPIRQSGRKFLGFKWRGQLFFDSALAMGCSSSSKLFQMISDALVWIAKHKFGCSKIVNVLDDFLFIETSQELGHIALGSFIRMCAMLNIPLKESKTVRPCTSIEFLGLILDSVTKEVLLPLDKINTVCLELQAIISERSVTLRRLQSIIGRLNFACSAIPLGRPFLRRLIDATRGGPYPGRKVCITKRSKNDLEAWLFLLSSFNGRSMMAHRFWDTSRMQFLYTDAAGSVGFGATFKSAWLYGTWPSTLRGSSIAVKEMVPIVIAIHTWLAELAGQCVKIISDNLSVVCAINAQSCRDPALMAWVRRFFVICVLSGIHVWAEHIPSHRNASADALSRGLFQRFRNLRPSAAREATAWTWATFDDLLQHAP